MVSSSERPGSVMVRLPMRRKGSGSIRRTTSSRVTHGLKLDADSGAVAAWWASIALSRAGVRRHCAVKSRRRGGSTKKPPPRAIRCVASLREWAGEGGGSRRRRGTGRQPQRLTRAHARTMK